MECLLNPPRKNPWPKCLLGVMAVLNCSFQTVTAPDYREILTKSSVVPSHSLLLANETLNLTCWSQDNSTGIQWLKDGHYLSSNHQLLHSDGNRTLIRKGVTKADAGVYQCEIRNSAYFSTSDAAIVAVAYGPGAVKISPSGNITQTFGAPLILTCSADSVPVPFYSWFFNNTSVGQNRRLLAVNSTTWEDAGTYECWAYNALTNLTGRASVSVWIVTDQETPSAHLTLSPSLISGSVFGLLIAVAFMAVSLYCLCVHVWRQKPPRATSTASVCDNRPPGTQVRPEPKTENPPDPSSTYQVLQIGEEALYQELGR